MVIYNSPYETESKICTHFEEKECQSAFKKLVAITEAYDEDTQFALVSGRTISLEYDRPLIVQKSVFADLIKDTIFLLAENQLLPFANKKELMERMNASNFEFPQHLERTKAGSIKYQAKYEWCMHHPNLIAPIAYPELITVKPSILLQKGGNLLLEYLRRKFCDKIYRLSGNRTVQVPYGTIISNFDVLLYEYPNDVVTETLNFYGHNRCVSYTEPRQIHTARIGFIHVELSDSQQHE